MMASTQRVQPLDEEESKRLDAQRNWVRDHYAPEKRFNYDSLAGKLRVLEVILGSGWIEPGATLKLQSLGVTFGDALAQALPLDWVIVEDEHGRDPALRLAGTDALLFPLTMISKRVERGEDVNVVSLFQEICGQIESAGNAQ
jgi:hypothetical protein